MIAPRCRRLPSISVGTVATGSNSAVVGKLKPLRIAPRPAHQIVEQQLGDIDQHQAGEDFARAEAHLDRSPGSAHRARRRARRAPASPAAPRSRRRCPGSSPRASRRTPRRSGTGPRRRCSRHWRGSRATGRPRSAPAASPSRRSPAANRCRSADRGSRRASAATGFLPSSANRIAMVASVSAIAISGEAMRDRRPSARRGAQAPSRMARLLACARRLRPSAGRALAAVAAPRRSRRRQAAVEDHRDAVGDLVELVEVLADHQHRGAARRRDRSAPGGSRRRRRHRRPRSAG